MIFKSPFPPVSIPVFDLPTFIFKHAEDTSIFGKNQDTPALIEGDTTITFRELKVLSVQFASGLVNNLGLKPGDVVAIVLPNTVYYPIVAFGTHMMGGVCMTTNPGYNVSELEYQFRMTEPKAVITETAIASTVTEALQKLTLTNALNRIVTIDNQTSKYNRYWSLHSILSNRPFKRVFINTLKKQSHSPAFIVFSSGTSGHPKGVILSHRNVIANIVQCHEFENHDQVLKAANERIPNHRYIAALPLFHIYALANILCLGLSTGGTVIMMRKYSLHEFCTLSQKHKATIGHVVPPIILDLSKNDAATKYDLSSYVVFSSGAAPLSKELQNSFQKSIGVPVTQGYGLSEASPTTHGMPVSLSAPGSIGFLFPNIDAKIVDDDGNELGENKIGELCVRGPNVMVGYLKNPHATLDAIDYEGFLHTGDVGYVDEKGAFFISDRKKELIKYKGFQVPPAELEGVLTDHPAVIDCAVVPVYDDSRASEIPKAFVVLNPDHKTSNIADVIRDWVNSRVADHKKLRGGVEVIDQIPKSPSGKILRRILKDLEADRQKKQSLQAKL